MKKLFLTLTALCFLLSAKAYDFVSYDDGYYYTITSSTAPYTVQVTYEIMGRTAAYTDVLTIPATTKHGGITYTVTSIGTAAFYDNGTNGSSYGATSITLPSTIISIGNDAFRGCRKLTTITIPSSVTTISASAFLDCSNLATVTILSNITAINYNTFQNCSSLASITLPSTVTSIGSGAFDGCAKLTSITIPSAVTLIDYYAFRNCSGLTSITIPSGVTSIRHHSFYGCSGLTSATIPSTVTSIEDYAFNGCSSLATINCSAVSPPTIYSTTFSNTSSTVVVPCSSISTYKTASYWGSFSNYSAATFIKDGIRYQPNTSCNEASVVSNSYSGSVTIPSSVTYNGNTYTVTSIGDDAFSYCISLTSVSIPEGITSIGVRAFNACSNCTSINLPYTLTSIGTYAFAACGMSSVTIPKGVTSMGRGVFQNCTLLTSLTISEGLPFISLYAFSGCTGLKSVVVPASCVLNEAAFANCTGIQSATILSSVIGDAVFQGCTALASLQLSSSITSIGIFAFDGCTGLTSIYAKSTAPASITMGNNVFYNVNKSNCTLYVPSGKFSAYYDATQWQDFINIVEPYTWNGSAWSTTPNAASNAVINGNYSGAGFSCHDLTISAGKQVTISSGTLAVGGNLILKSDATGTASLIGTTTIGGNTNAELYMTGSKWHLVSPTVAGESISTFVQATDNAIPLSSSSYGMMDYNGTGNSWNNYYTAATTGNLTSGKGYSLRRSSDGTVTFTGTLTSGAKTVALTTAGEGWNCIGNPYSSAIGMNSSAGTTENFISVNSSILENSYACVYLWDNASSSYKIIGNLPSGLNNDRSLDQNYLQSGQGFFVKAKSDATSISFTSAMQSHQTATTIKSAQISWPAIRLNMANSTNTASTIIAFNNQMTNGLDVTYDAGLLRGTSGLEVCSRLVNDNGVDFAIQCLPENYNSLVIPIGLESKTGGEITFSAETVQLPADCKVILEDRPNKIFTSLTDGATYKTNVSAGTTAIGRFYIHTSNITTGTSTELLTSAFSLKAYPADKLIWIIGEVSSAAKASLFDVSGRTLGTYRLQEGDRNSIPASGLKPGVYLLKVTDGNNRFNTKMVIY